MTQVLCKVDTKLNDRAHQPSARHIHNSSYLESPDPEPAADKSGTYSQMRASRYHSTSQS